MTAKFDGEGCIHLPDRPAPPEAQSVNDLRALVQDGVRIRFTRTVEPVGEDPYFFKVAGMGEYINPWVEWPEGIESWDRPRPDRLGRPGRTLASMEAVRLGFSGDLSRMASFYHNGDYILSDALHDFIAERDPGAFESRLVALPDKAGSRIVTFQIVRPMRVLDCVDITKTNVVLRRPSIGSDKFITHVHYEGGYALRTNVPEDALTVFEEQTADWIWRHDLVEAVKEAGFYGMYARPTYRRSFLTEIRMPGPHAAY